MKHERPSIIWCAAGVCVALAGCARDSVSLGDDGRAELPLTPSARCADDPFIDGDVVVTNQSELDALAGCEAIGGGLTIEVFAGTDLTPLGALRAVGGELVIGARSSTGADTAALAEAGWLESLAGLEALERAGSLALVNVAASDLSALSSLRHVNALNPESDGRAGTLNVSYGKNLVDFRGLERVSGIQGLVVQEMPALESLEGLRLPGRFNTLMISTAPRLKNIDALAPLRYVDSLSIIETGLEHLRPLSELDSVTQALFITDNPLLSDASSIPRPLTAGFTIAGNPSLGGTLTLPAYGHGAVAVTDNESLESLVIEGEGTLSCGDVAVYRNARLRQIAGPLGCQGLSSVEVVDNPSLDSIDLDDVLRIDELRVRDNARLVAFGHAALERAYVLDVVNNPRLSVRSLRELPAFERTVEGNAD